MIFILNRVDQRGSDDKPLDVRLQHLKKGNTRAVKSSIIKSN